MFLIICGLEPTNYPNLVMLFGLHAPPTKNQVIYGTSFRGGYCMHVNTQLNHSSKYNNPTDRQKSVLATKCHIFCNFKLQTNPNAFYFLPVACVFHPERPISLLSDSLFYLFIYNSPETAGDRMSWRISLSHFPQRCEIKVRKYPGHTGGNGAGLTE